jgi:hypothetical protein
VSKKICWQINMFEEYLAQAQEVHLQPAAPSIGAADVMEDINRPPNQPVLRINFAEPVPREHVRPPISE